MGYPDDTFAIAKLVGCDQGETWQFMFVASFIFVAPCHICIQNPTQGVIWRKQSRTHEHTILEQKMRMYKRSRISCPEYFQFELRASVKNNNYIRTYII